MPAPGNKIALMKRGRLSAQATARVRRLLALADVEVHRASTSWRRTLPPILEHYKRLGLRPGTVVDVGVGPGTFDLYTGFPEARLLLVEPLEEWRGHMRAIAKTRPTEIVMAAAGAREGETEIFVHPVPWHSSVFGAPRGEETEPCWRTVAVVRLDDVCRGARGPLVLKIDVEGAELEVLRGATNVLEATELVLLELSLFELAPGQPLIHEVIAWMDTQGFVLSELYDGHNRLLDGSLARLDGAFVRRDGPFRRSQAYASAEQARQMHAQVAPWHVDW